MCVWRAPMRVYEILIRAAPPCDITNLGYNGKSLCPVWEERC
jgi:hypothetical protein